MDLPKNKGGRPKLKLEPRVPKPRHRLRNSFNAKYITKAREYIALCDDTWFKIPDDTQSKKILMVRVPTLEGLSVHLKIHIATLNNWRKKHPEIESLCQEVLERQADRLINGGLGGNYNATIAKLLLSSKHGYVEKSEIETKNEIKLTDEEFKAIVKTYESNRRGKKGDIS